jgi:hypothetical protein
LKWSVQDVLAGVTDAVRASRGEVFESGDGASGDRSSAATIGCGVVVEARPGSKHVIPVRLVEVGDRVVVKIGWQCDIDLDERALAVGDVDGLHTGRPERRREEYERKDDSDAGDDGAS